ncbi:SDR family oxidoreductase [Arenibaculum sp.]|jgi:NAD(P)-dependent dehydrogenase (short-subunit alcohol dehydrogenase family)|uniref:SDR family oxidoreductase n=1 Tax=Arenibaculum sp. TaxID=2865862 RepID=UPI002E123DD3|nr:SDR family oxidoreductase [Arenibaculum sp.]
MTDRLHGRVVVITGASSGIGRAAARMFAREGAVVVLTARREPLLHEVADEVIRSGGRAMSIPADVRDPDQLARVAERAVDAFGGIDVWINNAGVASFGRFEDTPPDAFAAVMNTTFNGVVNGFRAVLPHLRDRERGIIINTVSVAGRMPAPFHAAYGAAKHAVLGFTESVRAELEQEGLHAVHVCNILPGPIDTPFWQHAANFSGHEVQALPPVRPAEAVAEAMVALSLNPRREVGVGAPARLVELGMALAQGPIERQMGRQVRRRMFRQEARRRSAGALHEPMADGAGVSGGWRRPSRGGSVTLARAVTLASLGVAALYGYHSMRDR